MTQPRARGEHVARREGGPGEAQTDKQVHRSIRASFQKRFIDGDPSFHRPAPSRLRLTVIDEKNMKVRVASMCGVRANSYKCARIGVPLAPPTALACRASR
jgi:hypothetical protein